MNRPVELKPRDRLIVALDLPTLREAEALVEKLGDGVGFYKIGYQLAFGDGLPLVSALIGAGKLVFLDMKLHDIANTVARGVENIARMGVSFVTVHGYPETMRAAVEARGESDIRILAVTVLTSYDDADLAEAGYSVGVEQLVGERAAQAEAIGVDGLVCSPNEVAALRLMVGPEMMLVTPGIRPSGAAGGDHKRVTSPAHAIAAGANYLVVGRPILEAADPRAAVDGIVAEIAAAAE